MSHTRSLEESVVVLLFWTSYTSFWIEHQLFGLDARVHHGTNVLLHALNAVLVFALARRLKLGGAWLAGLLFAVHPGYDDGRVFAVICDNYMIGADGPGACLHKTEKKVFEL